MKILQKFFVAFIAMMLVVSMEAQVVQKHSFKFDGVEEIEGIPCVVDEVSGVKGELIGNLTVADGVLKLEGGYVNMDANSLNLSQYGSITIEAFFKQSPGVTGNKALFSFGNTLSNGPGVDYILFQPTRNDGVSELALTTGDHSTQTSTKNTVRGDMFTDTRTHYIVAIVTGSELQLYMDGNLMGITPLDGTNSLSSVSSEKAYLGWSTWTQDAKWEGTIEEFNIYEGAMTSTDVEQRFLDYMGENYFNPLLKSLSVTPGEMTEDFEPDYDYYEVIVPFNTRYVSVNAETEIDFAELSIMDDSGNPYAVGEKIFIDDNDEFYIDITSVAADGVTSQMYEIAIVRADGSTSPHLEKIELSVGQIAEEFESDTLSYSAVVPYGTESVVLSGVAMHGDATVENSTVDLSSGSGVGQIKVTSEDGEHTLTYTVEVLVSKFRADNYFFINSQSFDLVLRERDGDGVNHLSLNHPYLNDDRSYFRFVESGVADQYYIQNKLGNYISLDNNSIWNMPLLGEAIADSSRFIIDEIGPNQFHIKSVGRLGDGDGKYHMGPNGGSGPDAGVYSDKPANDGNIVWNLFEIAELVDPYDTYLESLEVAGVEMFPNFSKGLVEYTILIGADDETIEILATATDSNATVEGAGTVAISDNEGAIVVKVNAPDPQYYTEYTINYKREMPFELRHSYTFADGTARDVVGDAHGTIVGGEIINGEYISSNEGDHIVLDSEKIAINEYTSLTLELFFTAGDGINDDNTMIVYLGNTNQSNNFGVDYLFLSHKSRVAVSCVNHGSPWANEDGISAMKFDDGSSHHFVATMTNGELAFYIDGNLMATQELRDDNKIFNLSNEIAYIAKGGYAGDKTWKGGVLEFNIYSGVMEDTQIALRSQNLPVEDGSDDVSLSDLLVDGELIEGFSPYKYDYQVELEDGETELPEISALATNSAAEVVVTQATELPGVATVKVTTANSEITYTIEFVKDESGVGIQRTEDNSIVVYPTVSTGEFTLATGTSVGSYTVYDLAGNAVVSNTFAGGDVKINIDNNGVYILQVNVDGKISTMKIIKR